MIYKYPAGLWLSKQEPSFSELRSVWRAQDIATRALELSFRNKVYTIFNKYANKAARDARQSGNNVNYEISIQGLGAELVAEFEKQYSRTMQELGNDFFDGLEKSAGRFMHKDRGGIFQTFIEKYIASNAALKVQKVTDTTKKIIRVAIEQSIQDRLTPDQMAQLIQQRAGGSVSLNRATTIARTETHSAAQYGQQAASESTGLQFRKFWIPSDDERVRADHTEAELYSRSIVIKNEEYFNVGGEAMQYPGDPSGSAEQVINCRCGVARRPIIPEN